MTSGEHSGEAQRFTNRLISETSPYLLQHAHNPVDWYPWGDEAFARARAEDKPILLSIGYSACHWCHVMAHESFENEATARLMNDNFVSIKVDREERPDIDALYMDAVQAMTGSGGWPMTVFLIPDGAPFYGGTYFPPQDRYGMPGFPTLLRRIDEFYRTRRDDVEKQAEAFREWYAHQDEVKLEAPAGVDLSGDALDPRLLVEAANAHVDQFDAEHGGIAGAPKFPHAMSLDFLLRIVSRPNNDDALDEQVLSLVFLTLDKMSGGGIYDQIGGGFHRYSTDAVWLVPHFEKMLYDNALLAPVYLHAWQLTGEPRYRRIGEEILDYVLREMTGPEGGFYSTQDADSEGEEGKFYVWTPQEIQALLGDDDASIAEMVWGVTARGNFEGKNILHVRRTEQQAATALDLPVERVREGLRRAREVLYAARAKRVWPGRDDKVLAAWNGLMLRAMAEAARVLGRDDLRAAAVENAGFLLREMVVGGRLRRTWRGGEARLGAYLEDYGAVVNGLLSTYELTGEPEYYTHARALADTLLDLFWDETASSFFDTARDAEALLARPRELTDNATPSGTSLAVEALLRLTALSGEGHYRDYAARVLVPLVPSMAKTPLAFGHLLAALDDFIGPFYEIAIVGPQTSPAADALTGALRTCFLPRAVFAQADPDDARALREVPLLEGRGLVDGKPAAYVCQSFVCQRPVTQPDELLALLDT